MAPAAHSGALVLPAEDALGFVPVVTRKGLSDWSAGDVDYFLKTGQTPDGDSAGESMARVIKNTSQLPDADRAAIAKYVKSLAPIEGPPKPAKKATD